MFGLAATPPLHLPLASGQSLSVQVRPNCTAIKIFNHSGSQKWCGRCGDRFDLRRNHRRTIGTLDLSGSRFGHRFVAFFGSIRNGVTFLLHFSLNNQIHQTESIESILCVQALSPIERTKVTLALTARKSGPTQQDGDRDLVGIEGLKIRLHDHHTLDQKSRQANGIRLVRRNGGHNRFCGLLDANVVHRVAVVGQNDVNQVFSDVVDVTLHRSQNNAAL